MFGASSHAKSRGLIRRYLADRGRQALSTRDERVVRHLAECDACGERYRELSDLLDQAGGVAAAEADAAFTPEKLAHQRDRILRRLEAHAHPARVLPFPAGAAAARAEGRARPAVRWVAAAAVAGLVIGLGVGRFLDLRQPAGTPVKTVAAARTASAAAASGVRSVATRDVASEEQFLADLDSALAAPSTPELAALEALTLRPRELPPGAAGFKN